MSLRKVYDMAHNSTSSTSNNTHARFDFEFASRRYNFPRAMPEILALLADCVKMVVIQMGLPPLANLYSALHVKLPTRFREILCGRTK